MENKRREDIYDETSCRRKNVQKVYGKGENQSHALKGVSFSIQEGEFVGIMGPSGSGKTTLLNVISTLDKATAALLKLQERILQNEAR